MVAKGAEGSHVSPAMTPTKVLTSSDPTHGPAAIKKLNEEVERKTKEAIAKLKPGEELPITYVASSRPMTSMGLQSGFPIYVSRDVTPTYAMIAGMSLAVAGSAWALGDMGLRSFLVSTLLMYVIYDFQSGTLHVVLDEPANIDLPYIGQPALEFQWHHHIPTDLVRKDFMDVIGDLNGVVIGSFVWHAFFSCGVMTDPTAFMLIGMKLFWVYFGQYSHRSAHDPRIKTNPVGRTLQKLGVMISVADHKAHHTAPHDEDFCLIGVCNPLVHFLFHSVTKNRWAWMALFLSQLFFDIVLVAPMAKALVGVPADFRSPFMCEAAGLGYFVNCGA
jgi:hypothetical protein